MKREFEIGDICRIREWDDLAEEFGVSDDGNIYKTEICFLKEMRPICGRVFTVVSKDNSCGFVRYASAEQAECDGGSEWMISADMLEPFEAQPVPDPIFVPGDFFSLSN